MSDFIKCIKCDLEPFCKPSDTCLDTTIKMVEHDKQIREEVIDEFVYKCSDKIIEICKEAEDDIPLLDIFDIKKIAEELKEQKRGINDKGR